MIIPVIHWTLLSLQQILNSERPISAPFVLFGRNHGPKTKLCKCLVITLQCWVFQTANDNIYGLFISLQEAAHHRNIYGVNSFALNYYTPLTVEQTNLVLRWTVESETPASFCKTPTLNVFLNTAFSFSKVASLASIRKRSIICYTSPCTCFYFCSLFLTITVADSCVVVVHLPDVQSCHQLTC